MACSLVSSIPLPQAYDVIPTFVFREMKGNYVCEIDIDLGSRGIDVERRDMWCDEGRYWGHWGH